MSIIVTIVKNRLGAVADGAQKAVYGALEGGGERILAYSQTIVPVDTGELKGSLFTEGNGSNEVINGATAPHSVFLELGTRNAAAQPTLVPAFEAVVPSIIQDAGDAVARLAGG